MFNGSRELSVGQAQVSYRPHERVAEVDVIDLNAVFHLCVVRVVSLVRDRLEKGLGGCFFGLVHLFHDTEVVEANGEGDVIGLKLVLFPDVARVRPKRIRVRRNVANNWQLHSLLSAGRSSNLELDLGVDEPELVGFQRYREEVHVVCIDRYLMDFLSTPIFVVCFDDIRVIVGPTTGSKIDSFVTC